MAHPYLSEHVAAIGRGGRGLLASVNQKNSKIRYFAFSVEKLFAADERSGEVKSSGHDSSANASPPYKQGTGEMPLVDLEPFGPVHFGHDSICPGTVALEPNSGTIAFTRDDPETAITKDLVIQYYD